jgi:5-methyltetrahydrofolate--homocysteine methyltransferase
MSRNRRAELEAALRERILIFDGPSGSMLQSYGLDEAAYRGEQLRDHGHDLKGDNDLLCVTRPDIVREVHEAFLEAGADIITTASFTSTSISQADYGLEAWVHEINLRAGEIASAAARAASERDPSRPRFVAGSIGPLNRMLSISPDVNDPAFRSVTFEQVRESYAEQVRGLIDGGVDLLLIETVIDTLNCKAGSIAAEDVFAEKGVRLPIAISASINDLSGRILAGQTLDAFWIAVEHADPVFFGLNCGLGATEMTPFLEEVAHFCPVPVSCYPNAGLPNAFGEYDEQPPTTAALLRGWAENGWLNLVGGCCGTTPDHIRAIAEAVRGFAPRPPPARGRSRGGPPPPGPPSRSAARPPPGRGPGRCPAGGCPRRSRAHGSGA